MTRFDLGNDLELAHDLADIADRISLSRYRASDLIVETKPDMTPVTEADRAVEKALRERLARDRPGDAVLGEEFGLDGESDRRWIIDPIDGTKNYVRGIPVYATLIALALGGEAVVGLVSAPALGRRWWARRGRGAQLNGETIHVSGVARLADAQLSYNDLRSFGYHGYAEGAGRLAATVWRVRGFGDFWSHVMVAEGSVDIAAEPIVKPWDLAALQVIVEEAGGRFTDLAGVTGFAGGSALSSNGLLHDEVLRLFDPKSAGDGGSDD
jgi:histidinol-phosphatase